ncbi:DUF2946 family protein [Bradyrhizobium sp. HKCCYLS20291]|uniref:DUF2946 family protein n=1 Tax=Bradyrhizobium sp. HKCCYLS20291 TaxID=3420766 RepID=UPI003EBEE60C
MFRVFGNKRRKARSCVALGLAYLLVFQAMMFSHAAGAMAGSAELAILDICSSEGNTTSHDGSGRQHHQTHIPTCCLTGGAMFGASAAPPPVLSLAVPRMSAQAAAFSPFARDRIHIRRTQSLCSPRGPPVV